MSARAAFSSELMRQSFAADLLVHGLAACPDRNALQLPDGQALTSRQLADLTSRYVQALERLDFAPGARIGILSRNRAELIPILNALMLLDLCTVPLHPMGAVADFVFVADDAQLDCLIFDPTHFEEAAEGIAAKAANRQLRFLSIGSSLFGEDLVAAVAPFEPRDLVAPEVSPESITRMAYSGGTTGRPKGIQLSQRALVTTYQIQMSEWEWPEQVRTLLCAPISHSGSALLILTLLRGGLLVTLDGFDPDVAMQKIEQFRITCTLMVPTMIYAMLDHPNFDKYDLSSLETIFYGAAPMAPERLREGISRLGTVFFQFYGQSEAPMSVCVMRKGEHDPSNTERLMSCGRPVPQIRIALMDDEGRPVEDGRPGEICVRGPLLMSGYANQPELTQEAFEGNWLHTGDIAVRDPDGFYRIVDRKKDMIITGGFNVYPSEIEHVLRTHSDVLDACVVGLPDSKWGEVVAAAVVCAGKLVPDNNVLQQLVRKAKGPHQVPKKIFYVDRIPLSPLGKPDKRAAREMLLGMDASISI